MSKSKFNQKFLLIAFFGVLLIAVLWPVAEQEQSAATAIPIAKPTAGETYLANLKTHLKAKVQQASASAVEKIASTANDLGVNNKEVKQYMDEFRDLFQDAGSLDYDKAKELVEKRKNRSTAMATEMAAMGEAAVPSILDAYQNATSGKEKLLLIDALVKNNNPAAVNALETIVNEEKNFSYRETAAQAIANLSGDEAEYAVANMLSEQADSRLKVIAVQALAKYPNSLPLLIENISDGDDKAVQLEAVRSVGLIHNAESMSALQHIIAEHSNLDVRKQAIMELARSFGSEASETLNQLAANSDSEISASAKRALNLIH